MHGISSRQGSREAQEPGAPCLDGLPVIWTLRLPERLEVPTPTLAPFHLNKTCRQVYHVNNLSVEGPQPGAADTAVWVILFTSSFSSEEPDQGQAGGGGKAQLQVGRYSLCGASME